MTQTVEVNGRQITWLQNYNQTDKYTMSVIVEGEGIAFMQAHAVGQKPFTLQIGVGANALCSECWVKTHRQSFGANYSSAVIQGDFRRGIQ